MVAAMQAPPAVLCSKQPLCRRCRPQPGRWHQPLPPHVPPHSDPLHAWKSWMPVCLRACSCQQSCDTWVATVQSTEYMPCQVCVRAIKRGPK